MAGAPRTAEQQRLLALVAQVPDGRVTTLGILAHALLLPPRRITHMLSLLDAGTRATVPWWRVVADGGAIGRHPHRDEQLQRLRAEGTPVAPAGIVRELAERRWTAFGRAPRSATETRHEPVAPPRSRARGIKSHGART